MWSTEYLKYEEQSLTYIKGWDFFINSSRHGLLESQEKSGGGKTSLAV